MTIKKNLSKLIVLMALAATAIVFVGRSEELPTPKSTFEEASSEAAAEETTEPEAQELFDVAQA